LAKLAPTQSSPPLKGIRKENRTLPFSLSESPISIHMKVKEKKIAFARNKV